MLHTATKEYMVSIEPKTFRKIMRRLATGVTVVTVRDHDQRHGMTANTFTSVSLTPTLVLICVVKDGVTHDFITRAGAFAVNVLSVAQREIAQRFAHQVSVPDDPFADIPHHYSSTGAPLFDDSIFFVDCRLVAAHDAGDHTIFVGEVLDMDYGRGREDDPLLFLDGQYATLDHSA